ncbi:hypothetical protein [Pseudomonas citronellolis]|uniref:hypothetical protein n=1 Tax=Pseudomonas citronellolis TaxID=53408 RepID=UPI002D7698C0|nr:hypothetical protein [Pseudomonas citronellolis]WRT81340.1 hypothetical protein VK748_23270 [Pseudomonas citronellolis]
MKLPIIMLLFASFNVVAGEVEVCKGEKNTRNFLSEWREGDRVTNILTTIQDTDISRERGRIAYQADLNGDGNKDYIFESFDSQGSAKDRTFGIFIQCKGFLQFVGGDYFAGVKEIGSINNSYRDVVFLSYQRDKSGEIIYADGQALIRSHVWSFNPGSGKYEGGID